MHSTLITYYIKASFSAKFVISYLNEKVIVAGRLCALGVIAGGYNKTGCVNKAESSSVWWHNRGPTLNLPSLSSNGVPVSPKWTDLTGSKDLSSIVTLSSFHSSIVVNFKSIPRKLSWMKMTIDLMCGCVIDSCMIFSYRIPSSLHHWSATSQSHTTGSFYIHSWYFVCSSLTV